MSKTIKDTHTQDIEQCDDVRRRFWIFGSSMKICAHFSKKRPWGVASAFKVLSSVPSPFALGGRPVYYTTTLWHVVTPRRACGGNIWSAVEHRSTCRIWRLGASGVRFHLPFFTFYKVYFAFVVLWLRSLSASSTAINIVAPKSFPAWHLPAPRACGVLLKHVSHIRRQLVQEFSWRNYLCQRPNKNPRKLPSYALKQWHFVYRRSRSILLVNQRILEHASH